MIFSRLRVYIVVSELMAAAGRLSGAGTRTEKKGDVEKKLEVVKLVRSSLSDEEVGKS